jgi:hypothetical protein
MFVILSNLAWGHVRDFVQLWLGAMFAICPLWLGAIVATCGALVAAASISFNVYACVCVLQCTFIRASTVLNLSAQLTICVSCFMWLWVPVCQCPFRWDKQQGCFM